MIELKYTDMCEECDKSDLELISLDSYGGKQWFVKCLHKAACIRMAQKGEAEMELKKLTDEGYTSADILEALKKMEESKC